MWDDGEVTLTVDGREHTLDVETASGWGRSGLVSAATLASLDPDPQPMAVWARASDGADAEDLSGDLAALAGAAGADLDGGHGNRSWVYLQVDILTGVGRRPAGRRHRDRARRHRATPSGCPCSSVAGRTPCSARWGSPAASSGGPWRWRGCCLSSVATMLGTAIGLVFAWVGVQVMVTAVVEDAAFTVPVWQVGAVAAVAALAGLAACVLPARRAAGVTPAAGLALD